MDAVSLGDLYVAYKSGFPMEHIIFHGNNKSYEELEFALMHNCVVVIDHLEELLSLKGQRFDKVDTMCFIKWCNPKKSTKKKDNEHELFKYIIERHQGSLRFYGWPSLFELRKQMGAEYEWEKPVAALNKKAIELWNAYNEEPWEPKK